MKVRGTFACFVGRAILPAAAFQAALARQVPGRNGNDWLYTTGLGISFAH